MKKIIQTLVLTFVLNMVAIGQENIQFPLLKKQIDSLKIIDQQVQQDFIKGSPGKRPDFEKIEKETFVRHTIVLKEILKKYGFPNFDKVGKESSNNYWLCVQHCDDDVKFQNEVLTVMQKDVKKKKADSKNYAYLKDRVNLNSGKPQIYGTQVTYIDRTAIPKELQNPRTVNKRRKEVGLEPIEDYLNKMTEMHRLMNPGK
jgi:hypothetical protein